MELRFLGACREVGKSCVAVETDKLRVALDCGMKVHDHNEPPALEHLDFDACILTHSHLDHSGSLPILYKHRYIPTFCTFPTVPITTLLLEDSEKIAQLKGHQLPYKHSDVAKLHKKFTPLPYNAPYEFFDSSKFELYDAGHIPGSAGVLFESKTNGKKKRIFYTGDFNYADTKLLGKAKLPKEKIDALVIESTYAFREHTERKELEKKFVESVTACIEDDCTALIPAFAVGRTQELLLVWHSLLKGKNKVFLDGMGKKISEILHDYPSYVANYDFLEESLSKTFFVENSAARRRVCEKPGVVITTAGMCLHPDTFVQQADGVCRKIKDVDSDVYSLTGRNVVPQGVSRRVANPSPGELLEVRTSTSSITCTSNHEFMVLDGFEVGWKHASDLKVGDYVAAVKRLSFKGTDQNISWILPRLSSITKKATIPRKVNPAFSQFLGYFIGDGHVKQDKIVCVTDKDVENLKFYGSLVKRVFGVAGVITTGDRNRLLVYSSLVAKFLKSLEGEKSPNRKIPEFIQKSSGESVAAFLRGLFDAEGTVSLSSNRSVSLSSSSPHLASVVQLLLLRFGIRAEKRPVFKRAGKKTYRWYNIRINKPDELLVFKEKIGFGSKAKEGKLKILLKTVGGGYSHADIFPLKRKDVYVLIKNALGTRRIPQVFGLKFELYSSNEKRCTKNLLKGIAAELSKLENPKALKLAGKMTRLLDSELVFNKILGKTAVKSNTDKVFDLTVPATSNYVAEGLIVHNCDGGPVLSYLRVLEKTGKGKVFLTGFQVPGTNGRALAEGRDLFIDGRKQRITLPVESFDFSAHSGAKELRDAIKKLNPEKIYCVHGDDCEGFAKDLREQEGFDAVAPAIGQEFTV